jgi:hypothetical protein
VSYRRSAKVRGPESLQGRSPGAGSNENHGHKTASMYRRYRIVDERDLKEATESLQSYLKTQPQTPVVVPIRKPVGE